TYYGYCRAACNNQANFEVVALFDHAWFTQLAVDQAGHPRLLIATWPPESGFDPILHWIYAECNANCTNPAAWAHVDLGNGYWYGSDTQSKQTFVLDTHGHPRLIYYAARYNAMVDPSADMRFMYCDADCTNLDQWNTTILSDSGWYDPALVLTPSGLPRIAFNSIGDNQLNYVECDTPTCSAGTLNTILTNSSNTNYGGPSFSLKLDGQGRPRMAYYPGLTAGTLPGGRLYYLACDANCTATGTWRGGDIGMPTTNESGSTILQGAGGVALALDTQDHPRIAFRMGMGMNELGYAWCNTGCENEHTTWPYKVIWSSDAQLAEIGVPPAEGCPDCHPPIPPCPGGFWDAGFWPSLTLDAAGNPRIAYEVQLQHGGGQCDNATWAHMTRLAVFQQP
ncbi:MAG TPA: hypothetical protein VFT99_06460, partial [Roseiflexaceae bacterium]|nr:hypothetical protein [Roseiflexaceae bacterium]